MAARTPVDRIDIRDCELNEVVEPCDRCGRETVHEVAIVLADISSNGGDGASSGGDGAKYAREPCRVSRCSDCGVRRDDLLTRR